MNFTQQVKRLYYKRRRPASFTIRRSPGSCRGVLRCTLGGEVCDLHPGESGFTPRGVVHGFSNPFDQLARALVITTPDIGAQYFHDVAEVVGAPGGPDPASIAAVMGRYGLVPAPPAP